MHVYLAMRSSTRHLASYSDVTCVTAIRCVCAGQSLIRVRPRSHGDLRTAQECELTSFVWCLFFGRRGTLRLPRAYMMRYREAVSLALLPCAPMRLADYKRLLTAAHQASRNPCLMHKDPHGSTPGSKLGERRVNEAINRRLLPTVQTTALHVAVVQLSPPSMLPDLGCPPSVYVK